MAQAAARKAANLSRQEVLKKERAANLGDPVRGEETDYVRSFDVVDETGTASPSPSIASRLKSLTPSAPSQAPRKENTTLRNFFLNDDEVSASIARSRNLATPLDPTAERLAEDYTSDTTPEERAAAVQKSQDTAAEAVRRIANLSLGSSKDRMRVIKQRCIADFGRHNTETFLPPKPVPARLQGVPSSKTPAAGPDTGSSEVQIAILTAKIRTLADFLGTRGTQDKMNKRNLRLLVHKRQKLLQYLRRKERGGPRWRHVIETLGLTEGTWRGEITV